MKKHTLYIASFLLLALTVASCEKVLDRPPLDRITDKDLAFTKTEMELYSNQFYTSFPGYRPGAYDCGIFWGDLSSDNMIYGSYNYNAQIAGTITVPSSGGGWDWGNIRAVNYFLANYHVTKEPFKSVQTYIGEMYFWHAWFYYGMLKQFGALPWYNRPLESNDPALYAARLPRNVVVDSILSDLDRAISLLDPPAKATPFRIHKDVALLFKSRVALYEGSWEKYHAGTPFGVDGGDYDKYFRISANATEELMASGDFSIVNGEDPKWGYWRLFNQTDYSGNNEIMLWKKFDKSQGLYHYAQNIFPFGGGNTGVSKQLVDYYLCTDGKPISLSMSYKGDDSLLSVIQNRDPRLAQTIYTPGDPRQVSHGDTLIRFTVPDLSLAGENKNTSGYQLFKGCDPDVSQNNQSTSASIIFRYAEALLNYAEAKAELGECTQAVLDETINKLRDRVGMPHLTVNVGFNDPDWNFPELSPLMNEIRRERRIELACEGYRFDDLMRWAAAKLIKTPLLGAKYSQFENKPFNPPLENVPVSSDGYIFPYKNSPAADGWQFDPSKNYLKPIPSNELTINNKLTQNPKY